jgi:cyanophycinase-like exopeptidase
MSSESLPRVLCIMGSGETSPTMVSVHGELLDRLGPRPVRAVLLDTPFGFQENADDIAQRAQQYFQRSIGNDIEVAKLRGAGAEGTGTDIDGGARTELALSRVRAARYVFSGPGSPTYALRQWQQTPVPSLLQQKLRNGGCVTFASAAACTLGVVTPPVYEMYKVGHPPAWYEGLDVLGITGIRGAVIPHFNNAEGGTHDTRYCYIGERRLRVLEEMLPDGAGILGVDEHTACIIDLDAQTLSVRGRGVVTWRVRAVSRQFPSGSVTSLDEVTRAGREGRESAPAADASRGGEDAPRATPFSDEVHRHLDRADAALAEHDAQTTITALLDVEAQLHAWQSDTLQSDEQEQARAALRGSLVRLGEVADAERTDTQAQLREIVERVLAMRDELRASGDYALADRLRDALTNSGIEVQDTRRDAQLSAR